MSPRTHLWLRLTALGLIASAALWPRARNAPGAAELGRTAPYSVAVARAGGGRGAQAVTTAGRLAAGSRTEKLVVASVEETPLND